MSAPPVPATIAPDTEAADASRLIGALFLAVPLSLLAWVVIGTVWFFVKAIWS